MFLFNVLHNPGLLFEFLRQENGGSERFSDVLNVTQPVSDKRESETAADSHRGYVTSVLTTLKELLPLSFGCKAQRETGVCSKSHSKTKVGLDLGLCPVPFS